MTIDPQQAQLRLAQQSRNKRMSLTPALSTQFPNIPSPPMRQLAKLRKHTHKDLPPEFSEALMAQLDNVQLRQELQACLRTYGEEAQAYVEKSRQD